MMLGDMILPNKCPTASCKAHQSWLQCIAGQPPHASVTHCQLGTRPSLDAKFSCCRELVVSTKVLKKGIAVSFSRSEEMLWEERGLGKIRGEGMPAWRPGSGVWAGERLFSR